MKCKLLVDTVRERVRSLKRPRAIGLKVINILLVKSLTCYNKKLFTAEN